ncbi:hypothetical protein A6A06_04370 [Streptomyces sp. CB02923]|uniref:hypothetical protein n=1 Tax=Streptomyces sp. CB02923 TaxID=1718985 RepID=UPI00093F408A|nr:hypothetical protein [Streptomyces sp. CB02923]OKI09874.1 hypothetical protein A6A06_04370 [Streptomyces sp. CB02923]
MADDRYDWLDEEAAERLLRGEPAGSPDGTGAAELTALLHAAATAGRSTAGDTPLPGEEAALAAFRQARGPAPATAAAPAAGIADITAARAADAAPTPRGAGTATHRRFGRPLRRGFMVALAGCALGGVAVAAGTGVLPTPFRSTTGPAPATSVSAAETPGPLATDDTAPATGGASRMPDPAPGTDRPDPLITDTGSDGGTGGTPPPGAGRNTPGQDATGGGTTGDGDSSPDDPKGKPDDKEKRRLGVAFCRTYESGQRSVLDQDTLRRLERAAGGPEKVHAFCRQYLSHTQDGTQGGGRYDGDGRGNHGQGGHGHGHGGKGHGGKGDDEDDDHHGYAPSAGTAAPYPRDPAGTVTTTPAAPDELRIPGAPLIAPV